MTRYKIPSYALLVASALLVTQIAYAVAEHYDPVVRPSGGVVVAHRTAIDGTDSATTVAPIDPQQTYASPTVVVAPRFTNIGATVTVEVWCYQLTAGPTYTLLGISTIQTATATGTRRAGAAGDYLVASPIYADTLGADVYDVRYRDVSAGTVNGFAWAVGIQSRAAE